MDYQKIKYFLKAAETLNFSEAARKMYITPQAFGRQITVLEQEMGFPLFERSTRQTKLTPSGQICYEKLSGLVIKLEKEYEKMCEMGNNRSKQICFGLFQALSLKNVLFPITSSVLENYSERNINISLCDMRELQEQIRNGTIDLCIVVTHEMEVGKWDNCNFISLKKIPAKIVVSQNHPWAKKDHVTVEDMKESKFVKMDLPQFYEKDYFVQMPCKNQFATPNYESMCFQLEKGDCFTIMSAEVDKYCEENGKVLELPWSPFDFNLSLVYSKNNTHSFLPELCQFILHEFKHTGSKV